MENGDISLFSRQNIIEISRVIIYELKKWEQYIFVCFLVLTVVVPYTIFITNNY